MPRAFSAARRENRFQKESCGFKKAPDSASACYCSIRRACARLASFSTGAASTTLSSIR
jgi:hypothetical protein